MVYKGHIENGVAVLDDQACLRDGTPVLIEVLCEDASTGRRSVAERLQSIIGKAEDLPEDAAENHDHYLYGSPKK